LKLSRIAATGAATALVAASTLLVGGTVAADDFYYEAADFGIEGAEYPEGWFTGTGTTGLLSSGLGGLTLNGDTGLVQILNGTTDATATLSQLAQNADFTATGPGAVYFQIPMFGNIDGPDMNFTTLRPADPTEEVWDEDTLWTTSQPFGSFLDESSHTIEEYETMLGTADYEVLAYGLFVAAGDTSTVVSVTWSGDTSWFLPAPTAVVAPTTITFADFAKTGVTANFTGYIPGEDVEVYLSSGQSGGLLEVVQADANGAVEYTYSEAGHTQAGTFTIGGFGSTSGVNTWAEFDLTANVLPATGVDGTPIAIVGGILLLAGIGAIVVRRRANA
jgi:LPXTG-motif cell wall-anchored protein